MSSVGRESDQASQDKGRIKGVALRGFLCWYGANVDHERVIRSVKLAERTFSEPFEVAQTGFGILSSRWYAAEVVHAILDEITRQHAPNELAIMAEDASQAVMHDLLKGVYRSLIGMFVTPDRYSRHGEKLWALNYDNGRPVFRSLSPTEHHVTYAGWRSHHPFICRINTATALPLYTAMGCKNVRYRRLSCVSDGAAVCATSVHWK